MALDSSAWSSFSADPRTEGGLRASDADRSAVFEILNAALAEGLLDIPEHGERLDAAAGMRRLGEAVPLVEDLIRPDGGPPGSGTLVRPELKALDEYSGTPTTPEAIDAAAVELYREDVRKAIVGAATPSLITVLIWAVTCFAAGSLIFFWPAFVILGTGIGVITTVSSRSSIIRRRREMLTTRARARLGDPRAQAEIESNPSAFRYEPRSSRAERRARRREIDRRLE